METGKDNKPENNGNPAAETNKAIDEHVVEVPQYKQYPNLHDLFDGAAKSVDDSVSALADKTFTNPVLVKTTPGIGKTESGIHLATRWSKIGNRNFYAVPTRDMCWQIWERFKGGFYGQGHKVVILEGRHNGYVRTRMNEKGQLDEITVHENCYNYDRVQRAASRGYPPGKFVCPACPYSPHHKNEEEQNEKVGMSYCCPYYKTLYQAAGITMKNDEWGWAPIILVTHQMMATIATESELIKPGSVIIDEDWAPALTDTFSWPEQELTKKITGAEDLSVFRKLLFEALQLAKKYKHQADYPLGPDADKDKTPDGILLRNAMKESKLFDSYAVWGKRLALYIKIAAKNIGFDYKEVLEKARIADQGVDNGEYMNMTELRELSVPHYKEPELAEEILSIIGHSLEDKEFAYTVSLRWEEKQGGWCYHWQNVRRMKYGGPTVFLDAYGDEKLIQRITGQEVDVIDVHCKVRNNVYIHAHTDVRTSKSSMAINKDKIFDEYVHPYLIRFKNKKVLFYSLKCYENWLRSRVIDGKYDLDSFVCKHFWQDRGDDSYGDYDAVIMVGTPLSNIVAERHFANARFAGEEPLDWSTGKGFVYNDERVQMHMDARQYKEMLQAIYRLREAKPRKKEQHVVIISTMKIDFNYEMPGSTFMWKPKGAAVEEDKNAVFDSIYRVFKTVGGWTDLFCAFVHKHKHLAEWLESVNSGADKGFFFTYEEMKKRYNQWRKHPFHLGAKGMFVFGAGQKFREVMYRGKNIRVCGDVNKVIEALELIRKATREPGVDDDYIDPQHIVNFDVDSYEEGLINPVDPVVPGDSEEQFEDFEEFEGEEDVKKSTIKQPPPPGQEYVGGDYHEPDHVSLKSMELAKVELLKQDPTGKILHNIVIFAKLCKEIYEKLVSEQANEEFEYFFGKQNEEDAEVGWSEDEFHEDDTGPPPDDS